LLSNFVVL